MFSKTISKPMSKQNPTIQNGQNKKKRHISSLINDRKILDDLIQVPSSRKPIVKNTSSVNRGPINRNIYNKMRSQIEASRVNKRTASNTTPKQMNEALYSRSNSNLTKLSTQQASNPRTGNK